MSDMNYRSSYEFPYPNRKLVSHYLRNAKTAAERKVWRNMLNSDAFHKQKTAPQSKTEKKVAKELNSKAKKK